jgi:tetratricopeptide (TPR) repeat protein
MARGPEAVRLAESLDHWFSLAAACWQLGRVHGVRGEFDQALRLAERGLTVARDWNLAFQSVLATGLLGHMYALSGRVAESLSLLHEALTAMESMGLVQFLSPLIVHLGEAHMLADRLEDALIVATRGLTLASERGHRGVDAWALRLLGEIASHRDTPDVETAESHYHQALARAEELGMRPLVAHCHLGLGKLYCRTGDRAKAQEHLTTATTMYREMDMGFWLEPAGAALKDL